jgi:hypothetical protein
MKREEITDLSAIPLPFAFYGETIVASPKLDPFTDPAEEAAGKNFFDSRWAWDSSTSPATPPSRVITRQLMNRLFAQISGRQFLKQCGALDTFDQNVCDAIGGYPQGAVLQYLDGDILYDVVSMRDNNDTDYTKVGVDGINWRLYGSSVFSYVYPDYGSTGQDNILKTWDVSDIGWSFVFQGGSEGFTDSLYVSDIFYSEKNSQWVLYVRNKSDNVLWNFYINENSPSSATNITFTNASAISVIASKTGSIPPNNGILSGDLSISSACWIQAFITNPTAAHGIPNYECGIALYNQSTARPSAIEDLKVDNTNYTVYELEEIGTIATAILPVLPGNKISAFSSKVLPREIIIRKLTPVRTR